MSKINILLAHSLNKKEAIEFGEKLHPVHTNYTVGPMDLDGSKDPLQPVWELSVDIDINNMPLSAMAKALNK